MSKLSDIVRDVLSIDPSAGAIEFEGAWWSWDDLHRIGRALESLLSEAGLGGSARIGGLMRNRPEMAAALLQVVGSDRCIVTLNPALPDEALAKDISTLRPPAIVGFARDWQRPMVFAAAKAVGCLGIELTTDIDAPARLVSGLEGVTGSDLCISAEAGVAIEMLTSGTTGSPKRVPLKRRTLEQAVLDAGVYDNRAEGDAAKLRGGVVIFNAPFAHIGGIFGLFNAVVAGRKLAMLEKFSVVGWVDAIVRHRPKVAGAPPSALRMILDAGIAKDDLASLRAFRTGTAPLDPDLADEFFDRYGIPVLQNYSATEFAGAGAGWTIDDYRAHHKDKRGSVGRINPGIKARVVDVESGAPLLPGEQGLLEIQAPHLGDGRSWLRTTDLAVLDADDFLWIRGRADNAIIRGGFKVNPDDVVRAIEQHPAVREAAVVALPDARLGQIPSAAYVLRSGAPAPSEEEIREFLRGRLLPYQIPARMMCLEELPRTPSLKVSQPELKAILSHR